MNYEYWKKNYEHWNVFHNAKKSLKVSHAIPSYAFFISSNWQKKLLDKENIKWVIKPTVMKIGEGVSVCGITHD